jgi:excisionase family DNA binding protein
MEAKLLKNSSSKDSCDYLLISLDDQSFTYLEQGNPVRVAFFVDDKEGLPWYERKYMVATIGKNLDFKKYKTQPDQAFRKGLVDKSYLIDYINKMKQKLIKMALQDLETIDITNTTQLILNEPEEPEWLTTAEAAEVLNISKRSLLNLVRKKKIKGEFDNANGWIFLRSDIQEILNSKPAFMKKIWKAPNSIAKRTSGQPKEVRRVSGE